MFKFLSADLPVLLNVDLETYQIIVSVYFLLLFVGIGAVYNISSCSVTTLLKIWFSLFFEKRLPSATRTLDLNFALGP